MDLSQDKPQDVTNEGREPATPPVEAANGAGTHAGSGGSVATELLVPPLARPLAPFGRGNEPTTIIPTLVSATVTFKTNNDDKHRNSYVSVTVRDAHNAIIAQVSDIFDEFKDNRQYGPYDMHVMNPTAKNLVRPGGSITIYFGQDANDEWHTNILIDLAFSDGSHIATEEQDLSFTGDKPKKVFGI